jgi:polyphosphate kinase 2 (PPK2 family)
MSTVQELNTLLAEAQKELTIWQQVAIVVVLQAHQDKTGEGMTEEEVTAVLEPLADQLRAFNQMTDDEKDTYTGENL